MIDIMKIVISYFIGLGVGYLWGKLKGGEQE
jgi:hypothetical protein